jgi:hypothetical protein
VTATGKGFSPGVQLAVSWNTVTGGWKLAGTFQESYMGRSFQPVAMPLASVSVDASGAFSTGFTVPDGFGFSHDVTVTSGATLVNKAAFNVTSQVSIAETSGPVGTPIHITMRGEGYADLENSWAVTYDNRYTGWLSSVTTNGLAQGVFPATGAPGVHVIKVVHASLTVPYLNMEQSPRPDRPIWTLTFTITPGAAVQPAPPAAQVLRDRPAARPTAAGPQLWTDLANATVGTPVNVQGAGFTPGQTLTLRWWTMVGSRVSGNGWDQKSSDLGSVTAGADGSFVLPISTPDDLGGDHRIEAVAGDTVLAGTNLIISPSALPLSVSRGPAGTDIVVHLKGVGWTETSNIYTLDYDNAWLGYACGFNSQGDVQIHLPAAGDPGWHYIDLYPAIYKGQESSTGVNDFRVPMLSAVDHPHEQLPIFHFAFELTP